MEKEEEVRSEGATRIFVGGLGENATENDVAKVFSSLPLGKIDGIEIVRTKGRSFAYFNLFPSSDNSLAKLFSTYNGCAWKGGRLKLEKAKERYLDRLRREWAEDEALAHAQTQQLLQSNVRSDNNESDPIKFSDTKIPQQQKLKIFFPKLRKTKMVPFRGTGKHKYSFQRVDARSVPLYFCDCEEHIDPAPASAPTREVKETYHMEDQSSGMKEEEINIMNSVMKMLFEKENVSESTTVHSSSQTELAKAGNISVKSIDNMQRDMNEPDNFVDGDDNLILNLVSRESDQEALLGSWPQKSISVDWV